MTEREITQALQDTGWDSGKIQEFMALEGEGRREEALRLLSCYRCQLVCAIHEAQRPVDILDYLIHQLQKKPS